MLLYGLFHLPGGIATVIIQSLILRFLLGTRGRRVMAPDYREIIRLTPNIQSPVARWGLVLIAVQVVILLFLVWMAAHNTPPRGHS